MIKSSHTPKHLELLTPGKNETLDQSILIQKTVETRDIKNVFKLYTELLELISKFLAVVRKILR